MPGNLLKNRVRIMSRGVREDSQVGRIVAGMKVGECETGRQIAERMKLSYATVHAALSQRAKFIGDIVRMPEGFIRIRATPAPKAPVKSRGVESRSVAVARDAAIRDRANRGRTAEIVQPRTPPPFREWKPSAFFGAGFGSAGLKAAASAEPGKAALLFVGRRIAGAAPIRPGAEDYREVPSLYGDQRVRYQGARPVATTAIGAGARSGVK